MSGPGMTSRNVGGFAVSVWNGVAILLILLGIVGFVIPMVVMPHNREVAHIGDLKLQATEETVYSVPPYLAGGLIVLGVLMIGGGRLRRS